MSRVRNPLNKAKLGYPKLMKHIGIWIEDTDLNRRAAYYARQTSQQANSRDRQRHMAKRANDAKKIL